MTRSTEPLCFVFPADNQKVGIMIVKLAPLSRPKTSLPYWKAPLFAALLSAMVLCFFFLKPHSLEAGLPVFFSFLPMAFYFAAEAQIESQKQIRELRQRIEQLEAKLLTQPG